MRGSSITGLALGEVLWRMLSGYWPGQQVSGDVVNYAYWVDAYCDSLCHLQRMLKTRSGRKHYQTENMS